MLLYAKHDLEAVVMVYMAESPRLPKRFGIAMPWPLCANPFRCCIEDAHEIVGPMKAAKS